MCSNRSSNCVIQSTLPSRLPNNEIAVVLIIDIPYPVEKMCEKNTHEFLSNSKRTLKTLQLILLYNGPKGSTRFSPIELTTGL